jgi:hypothetical protein
MVIASEFLTGLMESSSGATPVWNGGAAPRNGGVVSLPPGFSYAFFTSTFLLF